MKAKESFKCQGCGAKLTKKAQFLHGVPFCQSCKSRVTRLREES